MSLTHDFVQAILSQFSQKTKASTDETDEAVDNAELASLEEVTCDEEQELDENDDEDNGDKLDPSVEASDKAMVDQVAKDAGGSSELPPLTRAQVNLGRFAITKVSSSMSGCYQD